MTGVTFTCRRCNTVVEPDASTWRCRCGGPFTMSPPRSLPDVTMGEGAVPLAAWRRHAFDDVVIPISAGDRRT